MDVNSESLMETEESSGSTGVAGSPCGVTHDAIARTAKTVQDMVKIV